VTEGELENAIPVGEFVSRLFSLRIDKKSPDTQLTLPELLRFGHFRGWLEDADERNPTAPLNRQTAARITHEFLRLELNIPDLADITPATKLSDLYICRACANHIAQVYCRGIMDAKKVEPDFSDSTQSHSLLIFNHLALLPKSEAQVIFKKLEKLL